MKKRMIIMMFVGPVTMYAMPGDGQESYTPYASAYSQYQDSHQDLEMNSTSHNPAANSPSMVAFSYIQMQQQDQIARVPSDVYLPQVSANVNQRNAIQQHRQDRMQRAMLSQQEWKVYSIGALLFAMGIFVGVKGMLLLGSSCDQQ